MIAKTAILTALKAFHGSDKQYRHWMGPIAYTEGVHYLAEACAAYWLLDKIAASQLLPELKGQSMQAWTVQVKGQRGEIVVDDGDFNKLLAAEITYTDFPLDKIVIWVMDNQTILLPSEY